LKGFKNEKKQMRAIQRVEQRLLFRKMAPTSKSKEKNSTFIGGKIGKLEILFI